MLMPDHGPTHPDDPGLSLLCFSVSVCLYLSVPRSRCMSLSIHCARVCARMCMCLPACLPAWFPIVCLSVSFFLPACCLPACLPACLLVCHVCVLQQVRQMRTATSLAVSIKHGLFSLAIFTQSYVAAATAVVAAVAAHLSLSLSLSPYLLSSRSLFCVCPCLSISCMVPLTDPSR